MNRKNLVELHFITPIDNVPTILKEGILSNHLSRGRGYQSIAKQDTQNRRAKKAIPGARQLHEYANLYFHARNPMMFKRRDLHETLCVLRISPAVADLPGAIVTDQNAASDYVRFAPACSGLGIVDEARVFARYWTHPDDPVDEWRHKSQKCAELLVPNRVEPTLIMGAYVSGSTGETRLRVLAPELDIKINRDLFFQAE